MISKRQTRSSTRSITEFKTVPKASVSRSETVKSAPKEKVKTVSKKSGKPPAKKSVSKPKVSTPEDPSESEIISEEEFTITEKPKQTTRYMSAYEYCALINARIIQLSSNLENPKIPIGESFDPLIIATEEVRRNLISLVIRRTLPSGEIEDWKPSEMIFPRI